MITLFDEHGNKIKDIKAYELFAEEMGESTIVCDISFVSAMDFHPDWYIELDGEKYTLNIRKPSGKKDSNKIQITYSQMTFHSERSDLKRFTFMDFVEYGTDNPQPSRHNFTIQACTLQQFAHRFNLNLDYYTEGHWKMVLGEGVERELQSTLSFNNTSLWDALLSVFENYGVRWVIRNVDGTMNILVGAEPVELDTIFEYGGGNGLVSIERTNPQERIITRLRGKGGEKNLPANYFHKATKDFPIADPDTNDVLQDVWFNKLLPKNYRDYVRGYNAGARMEAESWAYNLGADDKLAGKPMNIVDYALSPNESDWGISYGAIEDNEEIFPTLQGATRNGERLDEVIDVEKIKKDSPDQEEDDTDATPLGGEYAIQMTGRPSSLAPVWPPLKSDVPRIYGEEQKQSDSINTDWFSLDGEYNVVRIKCNLEVTRYKDEYYLASTNNYGREDVTTPKIVSLYELAEDPLQFNISLKVKLVDENGLVVKEYEYPALDAVHKVEFKGIPSGKYQIVLDASWFRPKVGLPDVASQVYTLNFSASNITYTEGDSEEDFAEYKETFDIWIKNVWDTHKLEDESDADYAVRVWKPLASSEEMAVMFSDGMLAGEDYEFRIVGYEHDSDELEAVIRNAIHYDTSRPGSHWRLTLEKSDAEYDAYGKYLPNSVINAVPGNHFFFINILMPYDPYVYNAERRLQEYLDEQLSLKDREFPTFAITPSSIFLHDFAEADKIVPGNKVRIRNTALIGPAYSSFYIKSVTKRYTADKLNPSWDIVVSDEIIVGGSPLDIIEGEVETLSKQVYTNRQAMKDAIAAMSSYYLRKDGLADESWSPTIFHEDLRIGRNFSDIDFLPGTFGGRGMGIYEDGEGNRVLETDVVVVRRALKANEFTINQIQYMGGQQIMSAAAMTIIKVETSDEAWKCYFDTRQGSVKNLFVAGDYAYGQTFLSPEAANYGTYWAEITEVGLDYIVVSKTNRLDSGLNEPKVGDNVVQLGNVDNPERQNSIFLSAMGTGSPSIKFYSGIDKFSLSQKDIFGVQYDPDNKEPFFFNYGSMHLGSRDKSGDYITYSNKTGKVHIKADVELESGSHLDELLGTISKDVSDLGYLKTATNNGTTVAGGLVLTSLIQLGQKEGDEFRVRSGISGIYKNEKSIAAWFGGTRNDREAAGPDDDISAFAKSIFRMDGSGYFAKGNITWDVNGYGQIGGAGENYLIKWDKDGLTLGHDVKLGDTEQTVAAILKVLSIFEVTDEYVHVLGNRGFYSDSFISAGGLNPESGGGGGGVTPRVFTIPAGITEWTSEGKDALDGKFDTQNVVTALYDSLNRQVLADTQLVQSGAKFIIKLSFSEATKTNLRLVVIG